MARWLFCMGVLGLVSAPLLFALSFGGILPAIFGLWALVLVPAGCTAVYVGATADLAPDETAPSLMQVFAGGGRS